MDQLFDILAVTYLNSFKVLLLKPEGHHLLTLVLSLCDSNIKIYF